MIWKNLLKSFLTWLLTILSGTTILVIINGGSSADEFGLVLVMGGIFSLPAIFINWLGLQRARNFKNAFDRTVFLFGVNGMANLGVVGLTIAVFDFRLTAIMPLVWPFIVVSFIILYPFARDIIRQPYPEFHKEEQQNPIEI